MNCMQSRSIPCSILILTRNSGATLERCLKNLGAFGEVLIHDANSEDNTRAIAEQYGARVEKQYDTEEKSVRITDFTAMRFKQRDEATYDWVLYLDSDEHMSDELVAELAGVIPTLPVKTVLKFRRLPIIEGQVRTNGLRCPEIMPRVHNRTSGLTFKRDKLVHEKYVYDGSFTERVMKAPLYGPMEPVAELRAKDDFYVELEARKIREQGYAWRQYVRWILLREPLLIAVILFRILKRLPHYFTKNSVPFAYDWRYVRYHWRLFWAITRAMFARPAQGPAK